MTGSGLFRLGGWSAAVGGALMAIDVFMHLFVEDRLQPAALWGMAHEVWHIPGMIALPLALLGLVAIFAFQSAVTGRLGLWGFALLVLGMTVGAIYSTIFHGLFLPAVEAAESGFFETLVDNTTAAQFYRGVVVQGLGLGLGAILFGSATIKAKVFSSVTGWLFIGAAVFAAANQVWEPGQLVSRGLFALAFVWMGLHLTRRGDERPKPAS